MKNSFNNAGVATFHHYLFLLNITDRQVVIDLARVDLGQLLLDYFDMSPSQQVYILNMTSDFKETTGTGIAETWESGQAIQFQKDTPAPGEDVKDLVVIDPSSLFNTTSSRIPISIHIRYRSAQ